MAGLFDVFTNKNAQDAANAQKGSLIAGYDIAAGGLNTGIQQLLQQYGLAGDALRTGATTARGDITTNYGTAADALRNAYTTGTGALTSGYGGAAGDILAGSRAAGGALTGGYGAAIQPLLQQYGLATSGQGALADALGLSGPAGNARATQAFWNNPAIKSQLDIGSENVLRNASRTGSLASGGTNVDLQNLGQQVASQGWGQYLNQLAPFLSYGGQAAGQLGNAYTGLGTNLAGLYTGTGGQLANLSTGLGTGITNLATGTGTGLANTAIGQGGALAGIATGQGTNLGNLYTGLGGQLYGAQKTLADLGFGAATGVGNAQANADLANNAASANQWGAIMQGAKLLGGAAMGGAGGGIGGIGNFLTNFGGAGAGAGGAVTGAASGGAGAVFSDERLKEDIEPVGELFDGTNVYRYRYKGDGTPRIGLIAQEVERKNPDAVVEIGGFKAVDYGRATDYASKLARFLEAA